MSIPFSANCLLVYNDRKQANLSSLQLYIGKNNNVSYHVISRENDYTLLSKCRGNIIELIIEFTTETL